MYSQLDIKEKTAVQLCDQSQLLHFFSARLYVEGKIDYGEYTDKNNVRRQATTIIAGKEQHTKAYLALLKWRGGGGPWGQSLVCHLPCNPDLGILRERVGCSTRCPLALLVETQKTGARRCKLLHSLFT